MLRWASMVFRDENGVIHYCKTDVPETVCGINRLHFDIACDHTCFTKTIRLGDGLPLSPITVLPPVTCILCIDMETPPAWA